MIYSIFCINDFIFHCLSAKYFDCFTVEFAILNVHIIYLYHSQTTWSSILVLYLKITFKMLIWEWSPKQTGFCLHFDNLFIFIEFDDCIVNLFLRGIFQEAIEVYKTCLDTAPSDFPLHSVYNMLGKQMLSA